MLPSELPAFSAPTGVRSAPSRAAPASVSLACAGSANAASATLVAIIETMVLMVSYSCSGSESHAGADRVVVAVEQRIEIRIGIVDVVHLEVVALVQVEAQSEPEHLPVLDERRVHRDAVDILRPEDARSDRDAGVEHVVVVRREPYPIAPCVVGHIAVVAAAVGLRVEHRALHRERYAH